MFGSLLAILFDKHLILLRVMSCHVSLPLETLCGFFSKVRQY
jgi:hypothetical protein